MWARTVTPNKFGKWSVMVYLSQASYDTMMELKQAKGDTEGVKNVVGKDDDGYYCVFSRPTSKMMRGKVVGFAPPIVFEADGKSPLIDTLIGNGSDVTLKLDYYNYKKPTGGQGSALRLESIRVDTLVPFTMNKDFNSEEQKQVGALAEQPAQTNTQLF